MRSILLAMLVFLLTPTVMSQVTEVWALDDGTLVQRDEPKHYMKSSSRNTVWNATNGSVNIFGAKNEVVAFQVIIQAGTTTATDISVEFDSLQKIGASDKITNAGWVQDSVYDYRNRRIELFRAYYINIDARTPHGESVEGYMTGSRPKPDSLYMGWMPHALVPVEAPTGGQPFNITAGETQTVWCDIFIPQTQASGNYRGPLYVKDGAVTIDTLTINLQVFNFALSDTTHAPAFIYAGPGYAERMGLSPGFNTGYNFHRNRMLAFGHRHRVLIYDGRLLYSSFLASGADDYFSGASLDYGDKYEGPGDSIGYSLLPIGVYATMKGDNPGMGSITDSANWKIQADNWENWCRANAPHTYRYVQFVDEPHGSDWDNDGVRGNPYTDRADDFPIINEGIIRLAGWMQRSGNGKYLGRYINGFTDDAAPWEFDGPNNYITGYGLSYCLGDSVSGRVERWGLQTRTDPWGKYGYRDGNGNWRDQGSPNNLDTIRLVQHDSIIVYNRGWPAWGNFLNIDFPLAATRAPFWVKKRYDQFITGFFVWDGFRRFEVNAADVWNATYSSTNYLSGTCLYPGRDAYFKSSSKGLNGPIATTQLKSMRRGVQDYEYMWLAQRRGELDTNLLKTVVPAALDQFDSTLTPPYKNYVGQPGFKIEAYYYERVRAALADSLSSEAGEEVLTGTLTPTPSSRTGAGTVSLAWVTQGADSVHLVWGTNDSLVTDSDTMDFYVSATTDVTLNLYHSGSVGFSANATITVDTATSDKIANVSWESNTSNWTYYDNSTPAGSYDREASTAYHGTYRGRVTLPAAYNHATYPNVQLYSKSFSITSGTAYRLRAQVRGSSSASVRVRITNSSGTNLGMWKTYSYVSGSWTGIDTTFTATSTVSNAYVQFLFALGTNSYATAGTTFYVDSVSFIEQSPTELPAPAWYYPTDGQTDVDLPAYVSVNAVSGATSYTNQVDDDSTFASPLVNRAMTAGLGGASDTWDTTDGLTNSTTYYARANATGDLGTSAWSDTISFTTISTIGPKPTLLTPLSGAVNIPLSPTFTWSGETLVEPQYYVVEVTDDTTTGADTTYLTYTSVLLSGDAAKFKYKYRTKYYWRVSHHNSAGDNPSDWSYFTTGTRLGLSEDKRARLRQ